MVINIVRDNPSFFVAYFLFTQEFILNQKLFLLHNEYERTKSSLLDGGKTGVKDHGNNQIHGAAKKRL